MKKRLETDFIVIHCSATKANQNFTADDIRGWHIYEQGFSDMGYHWVIERDASLKAGRDLSLCGAHVKGHNHNSIGICLIGGVNDQGQAEDNFTSQQKWQLKKLVKDMLEEYPEAKVVGHHYFTDLKACPSFDVSEFVRESGINVEVS